MRVRNENMTDNKNDNTRSELGMGIGIWPPATHAKTLKPMKTPDAGDYLFVEALTVGAEGPAAATTTTAATAIQSRKKHPLSERGIKKRQNNKNNNTNGHSKRLHIVVVNMNCNSNNNSSSNGHSSSQSLTCNYNIKRSKAQHLLLTTAVGGQQQQHQQTTEHLIRPPMLLTDCLTVTTTSACKISHRKYKRSSNNTSERSNSNTITAQSSKNSSNKQYNKKISKHHNGTTTITARTNRPSACNNNNIRSQNLTTASCWCWSPLNVLLLLMQFLTTKFTTTTLIKAANTTDKNRQQIKISPNKGQAARCHTFSHDQHHSTTRKRFRLLPSLGATSCFTLLTIICLETVLLSTVSNCAKTFYMHWNTSNSIFRIDNTDHIIDVNKGNLAFEFDQVHIICPVYEPGTFENETEKYIIYNVSKVEYETCRITNADPRVIAICDKPQKLMFFTITFRPFTPQPGGLEFLPGNDYYFISTSSKDDLYRRIGGRCSTNNMKVVFKVCCAPEEKNKTSTASSASGSSNGGSGGGGSASPTGSSASNNAIGGSLNANDNGVVSGGGIGGGGAGMDIGPVDVLNTPTHIGSAVQHPHMNNINTIGINGVNTGLMPMGGGNGVVNGGGGTGSGIQLKPLNGLSGTSINTNVDQFNRIPMQPNGVNVLGGGMGLGAHGGSGVMLTPGQGGINLIPNGGMGMGMGMYPGQTGIRINNVASQQHHPTHKINSQNNNHNDEHFDKHPNEVVKNEELTYNSPAAAARPCWHWLAQDGVKIWSKLLSAGEALLQGLCRTSPVAIMSFKRNISNNNLKYLLLTHYKLLLATLATIVTIIVARQCVLNVNNNSSSSIITSNMRELKVANAQGSRASNSNSSNSVSNSVHIRR